ncbi:MAG: TetR/AcrR family transcriptional regulator [Pseudomonadota bacterium]
MALNEAKTAKRTQEQRSREMRQRLIEATLACLEADGYAGATISRVVESAGVSRGAHLHHFESKAALLHAAAEHLMKSVFRELGRIVLSVENAEDRLPILIDAIWEQVFCSRDGKVILELLIAARTDKELAAHLQKLFLRLREMFAEAAKHYFTAAPGLSLEVEDIFLQSQWLLRGMLLDYPLVDDPNAFRTSLDNWTKMAQSLVIARTDVTGPPPKPDWWDEQL